MEPYDENYGVSGFVSDDTFLRHHLYPTAASAQYWSDWLDKHPHRRTEWEQASKLLEAVRLGLSDYARTYLTEEAENQLLKRIMETNAHFSGEAVAEMVPLPRKRAIPYLVAAAAVAAMLVTGWILWDSAVPAPAPYQQLTADHPQQLEETVNAGLEPRHIFLPDSSRVILSPGSRMSIHRAYGIQDRVIYLSGQAEFDVVRKPGVPFLVYANEIVTKVLGTRFRVTAFDSDNDITVQVSTGKVSVYRNEALKEKKGGQTVQQELVLTPNQQAVFLKSIEMFSKSLIAQPEIKPAGQTVPPDFVYNETPVAQVFEDLKKAYEIEIVYDAEMLAGCQLTSAITDESFTEKLDIICKSIGATSEVIDGRVIITARGCR